MSTPGFHSSLRQDPTPSCPARSLRRRMSHGISSSTDVADIEAKREAPQGKPVASHLSRENSALFASVWLARFVASGSRLSRSVKRIRVRVALKCVEQVSESNGRHTSSLHLTDSLRPHAYSDTLNRLHFVRSDLPLPTFSSRNRFRECIYAGFFPRSRKTARLGSRMRAPSMFPRNMKVSRVPMSAWNFRAEKIQVLVPMARVSPVTSTA